MALFLAISANTIYLVLPGLITEITTWLSQWSNMVLPDHEGHKGVEYFQVDLPRGNIMTCTCLLKMTPSPCKELSYSISLLLFLRLKKMVPLKCGRILHNQARS